MKVFTNESRPLRKMKFIKGNIVIGGSNRITIDEPKVIDIETGATLISLPRGKEVWGIVNIPHYHEGHCPNHPDAIKTIRIGEWVCMNCGEVYIHCPKPFQITNEWLAPNDTPYIIIGEWEMRTDSAVIKTPPPNQDKDA